MDELAAIEAELRDKCNWCYGTGKFQHIVSPQPKTFCIWCNGTGFKTDPADCEGKIAVDTESGRFSSSKNLNDIVRAITYSTSNVVLTGHLAQVILKENDELEQIEASLATVCWWCDGRKVLLLDKKTWCCHCGGSGLQRTVCIDGEWITLYQSVEVTDPPPYLVEQSDE